MLELYVILSIFAYNNRIKKVTACWFMNRKAEP